MYEKTLNRVRTYETDRSNVHNKHTIKRQDKGARALLLLKKIKRNWKSLDTSQRNINK